jgi:hypothetical protein
MGGFAIPDFLKLYHHERQYLIIRMHLLYNTEQMVMANIIYMAAILAGWAMIKDLTKKKKYFCEKKRINIIEANTEDLLASAQSIRTRIANSTAPGTSSHLPLKLLLYCIESQKVPGYSCLASK